MKVVSYRRDGGIRAGVVEDDVVRDAGVSPLAPVPAEIIGPLSEVSLAAPVPRPGKIVCIGLNYRDHAAESGAEPPERPLVFSKYGTSVIGPGDAIQLPAFTTEVDYEAELGVVIGVIARGVPVTSALDHVFGYTCVNDVSARDLQFADGQWVRGKSLDTFCPVGPWIVTADEVPDPQVLGVRCEVNGRVLQDSSTSEMIFSVAELVSYISEGITLEPGDLIATGTPAGVGFTRTPPIYLAPGDSVDVSIERIGSLINPVVSRQL
ncbi:MAG: fumarylacetoacetate hydrolase family protein [Actinomycetota bacterium]